MFLKDCNTKWHKVVNFINQKVRSNLNCNQDLLSFLSSTAFLSISSRCYIYKVKSNLSGWKQMKWFNESNFLYIRWEIKAETNNFSAHVRIRDLIKPTQRTELETTYLPNFLYEIVLSH